MSGTVNRGGDPVKATFGELYECPGRIFGGGTGPTIGFMHGCTFVRGGTGQYTVIPDVNFTFVAGGPAICVSGSNFYNVTVTGYYNGASTGYAGHTAGATCYVTYQVTGATTNTATDLAAGEELWFSLAFCRTQRP